MIRGIVKTHGVRHQSSKDIHLEELSRDGFTVFKELISLDFVAEIKNCLMDCYRKQVAEVGGIDLLKRIKEEGVVRSMFAYNPIFLRKVLMHEKMISYLNVLFENAFTLYSQVGIISEPKIELYQTAWHREVQYQHFTSSKPIAVQTLFILDEFNQSTGGTFFLPGSHLFEDFPPDEYVVNHAIQPVLSPGDVVMMNSMLYHKAGINKSTGNRLLITNTFTVPNFASQFNYPSMISVEGLSKQEQEILGFRWDHSKTMLDWRLQRIETAQ